MPPVSLAFTLVRTFFRVLFRRLIHGPKHPAWDLRFEVIAEMARNVFRLAPGTEVPIQPGVTAGAAAVPAAGGGASIPATHGGKRDPMRRMSSPILPALARRCLLERTELAGLATEVHTPRDWDGEGTTVLYLHGGGYITCSPRSHRGLLARLSLCAQARCVAIDYRKAPEHPFPAAIEDALAAYRALLASGQPPERLAVGGDSAGGGLTLALLQRLRDAGEPMPACAILLSPWVDLESTGETIETNGDFDYLRAKALAGAVTLYLHGHDRRDPLASPIYADLRGLPPLLMQTGSAELFCSENIAFAERARKAGVDVVHEVEEGMVHVFPLFADVDPRARAAVRRLGAFVRAHCEGVGRGEPGGPWREPVPVSL